MTQKQRDPGKTKTDFSNERRSRVMVEQINQLGKDPEEAEGTHVLKNAKFLCNKLNSQRWPLR
jgi:hypothetical protein